MEGSRIPARVPGGMIAFAFAVLVMASLFFAPAGVTAVPRTSATSASVLATQAAAPQPRDLTFYMHNTSVGQPINGVSTAFTFDTLQRFGRNNTVSKIQSVRQDWRLYPVLAGPLILNGTIALHVFVSIDQAGAQITPTLDLSEVNASGATVWTNTLTAGAQTWWTTPHDLVVTTPALQHIFAAGSTIVVVATITSGVRVATIWYNASWVPTHVVIQSNDFARIHDVSFLDSTGAPRINFDPTAANTTIRIQANVTDPLGGYDIHWVNLSLAGPDGNAVLTDVPMTEISGTPISFSSVFQVVWNYSGQTTGRYNVTAGVVDQNGAYYFAQNYTTAGYLDSMDAIFYVGGLPEYVNVRAEDSESKALPDARIVLVSGGFAVDALSADTNGDANFTMALGTYTFQIWWEGVLVDSQAFSATTNVSAANPVVLNSAVYYPDFHAEDANGAALAGATVLIVHPNGTTIGPYKTNSTGDVLLSQAPKGSYGLEVSWRGVGVFTGTESVAANGVISLETAVYELRVTAKDGAGQVLPGAFVSVLDSTGLVYDAGITGSDGSVLLRLPGGNYTIESRYVTEQLGTLYDSGTQTQAVDLTASSTATITFAGLPIPFTGTLAFLFALAYAITVAALVIAFYLMLRRGKKSMSATETADKKE